MGGDGMRIGGGGSQGGGNMSFLAGANGSSEVSQALQAGGGLGQAFGIQGGLDKGSADQFASMLQEMQGKNAGKNGFDEDPNSLSMQDVEALLKDQSAQKKPEQAQGPQGPQANKGQEQGGNQGQDELQDYNGDGQVNQLDKMIKELSEKAGMKPEDFIKIADKNGDSKIDIKELTAAAKEIGGAQGQGGQQQGSDAALQSSLGNVGVEGIQFAA